MTTESATERWTIAEWCEAARMGRRTLDKINRERWPLHAKISPRKIFIVEAPNAYMRRIAEQQKRAA